MRAAGGWVALAGLAAGLLVACSGASDSADPGGRTSTGPPGSTGGPGRPSSSGTSKSPPTSSQPPRPSRPITIAFAGDTHFEGSLAARLDDPATAMGPMARLLERADLSIVNLETAITTRGEPQPKQYQFRAPPTALVALKDAGIDVATMANNHALDYGPVSVPDALAASRQVGLPVIGIGMSAAQAFRPWIITTHGQRVAFLAATAVLDAPLISSWSATASQPGLATALDYDNDAIVAAVQRAKRLADTVVVDLHYGSDLLTCPTDIQQQLVHDLVAAGADIVVGQHAHVVLAGGFEGSTYVDYGLGNFEFYSYSGPSGGTGVLTLTVDHGRVSHPRWVPGQIVGGLPNALTGSAAVDAHDQWVALRGCAGLRATPTQ